MRSYFLNIFIILVVITFIGIIFEYRITIKKNYFLSVTDRFYSGNKSFLKNDAFSKFILYPTDLCNLNENKNETNNTSLFIIFAYMMVRLDNFERRNSIRESWANRTLFPNLRLGFIVGKSNDEKINNLIREESLKYKDIIQGDFLDTYRNLTYKSLVAWKWIINYCSHAKLIVKIDDDIALNSNYLIKYFNINSHNSTIQNKTFYCDVCRGCHPIREKDSKWHASFEEYNEKIYNLTGYPTFCFGPSYSMSPDLVNSLYEASFKVKFFWLEDVYTGLLARYVQNINHESTSSKYTDLSGVINRKDFILVRYVNSNNDHRNLLKYVY